MTGAGIQKLVWIVSRFSWRKRLSSSAVQTLCSLWSWMGDWV